MGCRWGTGCLGGTGSSAQGPAALASPLGFSSGFFDLLAGAKAIPGGGDQEDEGPLESVEPQNNLGLEGASPGRGLEQGKGCAPRPLLSQGPILPPRGPPTPVGAGFVPRMVSDTPEAPRTCSPAP